MLGKHAPRANPSRLQNLVNLVNHRLPWLFGSGSAVTIHASEIDSLGSAPADAPARIPGVTTSDPLNFHRHGFTLHATNGSHNAVIENDLIYLPIAEATAKAKALPVIRCLAGAVGLMPPVLPSVKATEVGYVLECIADVRPVMTDMGACLAILVATGSSVKDAARRLEIPFDRAFAELKAATYQLTDIGAIRKINLGGTS